jgi:hypothetical protein
LTTWTIAPMGVGEPEEALARQPHPAKQWQARECPGLPLPQDAAGCSKWLP